MEKLMERLKDDSIKNEELLDCLDSNYFSSMGLAIYKIIDRKYCNEYIIKKLVQIAALLKDYKVAGPYQIGHLAIAALFLVENKSALECFNQIYTDLDSNHKFLVDNFIKGMLFG